MFHKYKEGSESLNFYLELQVVPALLSALPLQETQEGHPCMPGRPSRPSCCTITKGVQEFVLPASSEVSTFLGILCTWAPVIDEQEMPDFRTWRWSDNYEAHLLKHNYSMQKLRAAKTLKTVCDRVHSGVRRHGPRVGHPQLWFGWWILPYVILTVNISKS